jgi:hypothetical protein
MRRVKRLECLADCIAFLNDFHNPESLSYQLRNPGLCKAFSFKQLGSMDENGYRIFTSVIGGMRFLHQDLTWKCSGQTRAKGESGKLKPTSALTDLLKSFKLSDINNVIQAVHFLNMALQTDEITPETELKYFLTEGD